MMREVRFVPMMQSLPLSETLGVRRMGGEEASRSLTVSKSGVLSVMSN